MQPENLSVMKLKALLLEKEHELSVNLVDDSVDVAVDDRRYEIQVRELAPGEYLLIDGSKVYKCRVSLRPDSVPGDQSFEVVLNNSGKTFKIPPDKTILSVLIDAGEDPMHDCQRGDCGICQVGVIEGTPDHRDYILTDAEKAAGKVMQICVSRSKSPRLVLDL